MRDSHPFRVHPARAGGIILVALAALIAPIEAVRAAELTPIPPGPPEGHRPPDTPRFLTEAVGPSGQPAASRISGPSSVDPRLLLPGDGAIRGWRRAEEPRIFRSKELFTHIDGGAEEFLAHGFRALGVGGYRTDSLEIVAEIYDLGTPKGARAILDARGGAGDSNGTTNAVLRDSSGSRPSVAEVATPAAGIASSALGDASVLDPVQILFRRSRYYVAVTGFEVRPEVAAALQTLADSIDARIQARVRRPFAE